MSQATRIGWFGLVLLFAAFSTAAQTPGTATLQIRESAGIRRTNFPVHTQVSLPRGALSGLTRVRLREADADVPAQFGAASRWPDGSIEQLTVAVNVTIAPLESRTFRLEYGEGVPPGPAPRGLTVTEDADAIQVRSLRFSKGGVPLILSAEYRDEQRIGTGRNGLVLTDRSGVRHGLASARDLQVEILERGPLLAVLRYSGRMPIGADGGVSFVITFEVPSSKAWFKMTAIAEDPSRLLAARG